MFANLKTLGRQAVMTLAVLPFVCMMTAFAPAPDGHPDGLQGKHVLVFSKTGGYRHESITKGQATFSELAGANGFEVTLTEDATLFRDDVLDDYDAVVFLNTTGDILDPVQQAAFERFIRSGHGMLGIHAATDTESDGQWGWYTQLIGGHFLHHPQIQEARLVVADAADPAVVNNSALNGHADLHLTDEWYDFRDVNAAAHAIITIDRASYAGAKTTGLSPMVWSNSFDGGRAFYIGFGHRPETYDMPLMQHLILDGLNYAVTKP